MKRLFLLTALVIAASLPTFAQGDYKNINVVDTLEAAGNFKTLLAALRQTGLIDSLKGEGPFTVFAPNDAAFAKLPPGKLDALMKNPAELRSLLLYHVTAGKLSIKDLQGRSDKSITTLANGKAWMLCDGVPPQSKAKVLCDEVKPAPDSKAKIDCNGFSPITINNSAKVVMADLSAANGMIHVINEVLIPPAP